MSRASEHSIAPKSSVQQLDPAAGASARQPVNVGRISTAEAARKVRSGLLDLTNRLIADLNWAPAWRVTAAVAAYRSELSRGGVPRDGLLAATEACVRSRMQAPASRSLPSTVTKPRP